MTAQVRQPAENEEREARAARRFGMRVTLLMIAVFLAAVPFTALVLLVRGHWTPLQSLDNHVADSLHAWALRSSGAVSLLKLVTNAGGPGPMRVVALLLAAVLLVQRRLRLATYVVTTVAVAAVLSGSIKSLVGRVRPSFDVPISKAPGASFPSGHALTSLVVVGLVLLVLLPHLPARVRPALVAVGVGIVVAVGFSRIALGVHYVSDVLGGWVIGGACLTAVTAAFHAWQEETPHDPQEDRLAVD